MTDSAIDIIEKALQTVIDNTDFVFIEHEHQVIDALQAVAEIKADNLVKELTLHRKYLERKGATDKFERYKKDISNES